MCSGVRQADKKDSRNTKRNQSEVVGGLMVTATVFLTRLIMLFLALLCIPGVGAALLQHRILERRSQSQPGETSSWYNCQYNEVCIDTTL